ncbi:hypothetical protein [Flavobacterium humi]|uniref:Uncharacterized protein n=1 Tax=Flavobacterium humi TaxID=2562683 RepID=A0A4Z0L7A8_9FLAO|nr:hypothetical protein [Flavobacterium humi]TGD57902.1 hypothetical protein E4635_07785 [Flavobacterium humi]
MKHFLLLFTLFITTLSIAQNNRKAFTLHIAANETQDYKAEIPESPYFVKEKILQIYCGEKIYVECEITADTISKMKVVEQNINPKRTIEIEFTQDAEDRKNITTMLTVQNPFEKNLNYNALMFTPKGQTWTPTSIIPISAKLLNFETWPHAIITLVLDQWRFEK